MPFFVDGEVERKRTAAARLAVDLHEAAERPHDVIDDGEAEAGALGARPGVGLHAVELAEDLALLTRRDPDPVVGHAHAPEALHAVHLHENMAVLG